MAPFAPASPKRPNVILLMTDDQGYGDFSCTGNPVLKTPALDSLAASSIRFTNFHAAPACTPTRSQLLTGLHCLRNGASSPHGQRTLLKRGLRTMGDIFKANGYRTALYGKWHLGGNFRGFRPHERGFQDAVHFLRGGVQSHPNYWNSDLMNDHLYHSGVLKKFPGYATDLWFKLGARFVLDARRSGTPFFLYLPVNAPHAPLLVPERYRRPYLGLPKETATFFGMIGTVDEQVAKLRSMLKREGLLDDTIFVFLTDNGTAYGEKVFNAGMRGKKGSLYEGGHRVPLWVSWPNGGLRPAGDIDSLTQVQDVLPTLLDLCGMSDAGDTAIEGTSLAPLLRGKPQPELDQRMTVVQFSESEGQGAVLWNDWRLVKDELYRISKDPAQKRDVAGEFPEIAARMREHYRMWWKQVEPHLSLEPYSIGQAGEEVKLTAYDWWHGPRVYNWPHLRRGERSTGRYLLRIEKAGEYEVELRRWPREAGARIRAAVPRYVPFDRFMAFEDDIAPFPPGKALPVVEARVRFGDQEQSKPVDERSLGVTFRFQLGEGSVDLQTWFRLESSEEFGAYYVYIRKA